VLPKLWKEVSKIPDPRQPKKVKHKLTVVLLYGLLSFVLQRASRREANRELSRPGFLDTLQGLFPELESLPHADTLNRPVQARSRSVS
jgi:DDE_Tnp_1-associated